MRHQHATSTGSEPRCKPHASRGCRTGQTLFEISVMVTVLMVLAGSLLPVMGDSIANSRIGRARNDAAQIATALANFQRDFGAQRFVGTTRQGSALSAAERRPVDVLVSGGKLPALAPDVQASSPADGFGPDRADKAGLQPWTALAGADALDAHLRVNDHRYSAVPDGPRAGWNGPYLAAAVDGDPWGNAYLVNVKFLTATPSRHDARPADAVFVLSAGPNGVVETPFAQTVKTARAFGDDIVIRIQ